MTTWHEYQCSRCGILFRVKGIELSGNITCEQCAQVFEVPA